MARHRITLEDISGSPSMDHDPGLEASLQAAAIAIRSADALLIGAGAGMGVDSGLPDFRGPEGFWKAYPPFRGRKFSDLSTPHWFQSDPGLAWGFFGHRLNLYRGATPHGGFAILRRWSQATPLGGYVFTSNVDGQFQKAGFAEAEIVEPHGSIHFLQCTWPCGGPIWSAADVNVEVDEATIRSQPPFPSCPNCGAIARPNILMFGDWEWEGARTSEQYAWYKQWLCRVDGRKVVAIELGAGTAIPTVRHECEARSQFLIRINPRDADPPQSGVAVPLGAHEALIRIDKLLDS
jgi:NAD-dependent SIR2 family protein deacetylase